MRSLAAWVSEQFSLSQLSRLDAAVLTLIISPLSRTFGWFIRKRIWGVSIKKTWTFLHLVAWSTSCSTIRVWWLAFTSWTFLTVKSYCGWLFPRPHKERCQEAWWMWPFWGKCFKIYCLLDLNLRKFFIELYCYKSCFKFLSQHLHIPFGCPWVN